MTLNKTQLLKIKGGSVSSTLINAISRGIDTFIDLGKAVGSAIRRITSGKLCPF